MTSHPTRSYAVADFPVVILETTRPLYRVHLQSRHPAWFSSNGGGRFDPPASRRLEFGSCYIAEQPEGAYLEALGRVRPLPEKYILERACTEIHLAQDATLVDLTHPSVIGQFGLTGDISVGMDYGPAQDWASAFFDAGLDGVYYAARHDPTLTSRSIALFGPPGEHPEKLRDLKPEEVGPIDDSLRSVMEREFHIFAVPDPA